MTDEDKGRARLVDLAREHGTSHTALSMEMGRNASFLQNWVTRSEPRLLYPDDRLWLAKRFQVNERQLGARDPWEPGMP